MYTSFIIRSIKICDFQQDTESEHIYIQLSELPTVPEYLLLIGSELQHLKRRPFACE